MSRGEERRKLFEKSLFLIFVIVCISFIILFLVPQKKTEEIAQNNEADSLPLSKLEIKYEGENELSLRATVSREKLCEFASERGVNLAPFTSVLPENLDLFCMCGIKRTDDTGNIRVKIEKAEINGIGVPDKLLEGLGEIDLDFKRSLVYN